MTAENRPATGAEALEMLKQGNARYVDSLTSTDEYMQRRPELVKDQNPTCSLRCMPPLLKGVLLYSELFFFFNSPCRSFRSKR